MSSLPLRSRCSCIHTGHVQIQRVCEAYAAWIRTCCSRRDLPLAQNRTVRSHTKERGSVE